MYKECDVIMLPTQNKAHFGDIILTPTSPRTLLTFQHQNCTEFAQHLYIISNEEIENDFKGMAIVTVKDDTRIHYLVKVIVTEQNQCYCKEDRKFSFEYYSVKPIIATTDNDMSKFEFLLPKPSQQFIEKYIEEYNKCNIITTAIVEYEERITNLIIGKNYSNSLY